MTDHWSFWREQLSGKAPETTPGCPHAGYFVAKEYVAIPGGAKRVLVDFPCAIWREGDAWNALIDKLNSQFALTKLDEVDELFGRCCRNAITYERYVEMLQALKEFRNE